MDTTPQETTSVTTHQPQPQYFPIEFRGNGIEYTKLVLVNTALSILTLGIFSAWAKVRTRKYVYGNLYINNANFNYHADPLQILKGRLIIGALFLMYGLGGKVSVFLPLVAGLIFFFGMPWLLVRGMAFNMHNTSYRNIRFGFKQEYAEAYKVIIVGYLITIVTIGLGAPFFYKSFSKFRIEHTRFGKSYFKTRFTTGDFFGPYARLLGCYFLSSVIMVILIFISIAVGKVNKVAGGVFMGGGFMMLYGGILFGVALFNAGIFNLMYKMSSIEEVAFHTSMKGTTLFKIYIQNILFGAFTLGFGIPYGMYRLIKYKSQSVAVWTDASQFDLFASANATDESGAIADSAGDFWDIDVGF